MITLNDLYPGLDSIPVYIPHASVNSNPHEWEARTILRIIVVSKARTVFEIGTGNGATTAAIARLANVDRVWTLDLPKETRPVLEIHEEDWAWIGMDKAAFPDSVKQLWGDSATFDFSPYEGRCDFVFVMGAHSMAYIENDVAVAEKLVTHEGTILLHAGTTATMQGAERLLDRWAVIGERMAIMSPDVKRLRDRQGET